MAKLLTVVWVVLMIALGACSIEPDQSATTTTSTGLTKQVNTSIDPDMNEAVEPDGTTVTPTGDYAPADPDTVLTPSGDADPLPEPGDGLVQPKAPNTTKVIPPPQD